MYQHYPTPPKLVRLDCIRQLKKAFPKCIIGLSDHTENNYSSYAALGLGANIIERHYVDSKKGKVQMFPLQWTPMI